MLINCRECDAGISIDASPCPQCGCPDPWDPHYKSPSDDSRSFSTSNKDVSSRTHRYGVYYLLVIAAGIIFFKFFAVPIIYFILNLGTPYF